MSSAVSSDSTLFTGTESSLEELVSPILSELEPWTIELASRLASCPELGFREDRTRKILAQALAFPGCRLKTDIALTGLVAETGDPGAPGIYLVADIDAILTSGVAGSVAHSCGHHAQMAVMCTVFKALAMAGIPEKEGVRFVFVGTPAEEYLEMEYRLSLREAGSIQFLSGKQEMIRLGVFDTALVVLKYHSMPDSQGCRATVNGTLNGFIAKRASFIGKSAHAGAWPEKGINALNAASIAMLAIHAQRETFRDDDHIRVHPVMKSGGMTVNTVPDLAILETYVRGASFDAILDAQSKVDRALAAGAVAVGGTVKIENMPGYQPFRPDPALGAVLGRAAQTVVNKDEIDFEDRSFASDDIGDVASLVPTCQLGYAGFSGSIHGPDFLVADPIRAFIEPARILAFTACSLAGSGAAEALKIHEAFRPVFTRDEYCSSMEKLFSVKHLEWKPGTL